VRATTGNNNTLFSAVSDSAFDLGKVWGFKWPKLEAGEPWVYRVSSQPEKHFLTLENSCYFSVVRRRNSVRSICFSKAFVCLFLLPFCHHLPLSICLSLSLAVVLVVCFLLQNWNALECLSAGGPHTHACLHVWLTIQDGFICPNCTDNYPAVADIHCAFIHST